MVTPRILEFQQIYPNVEFDVVQLHKGAVLDQTFSDGETLSLI